MLGSDLHKFVLLQKGACFVNSGLIYRPHVPTEGGGELASMIKMSSWSLTTKDGSLSLGDLQYHYFSAFPRNYRYAVEFLGLRLSTTDFKA